MCPTAQGSSLQISLRTWVKMVLRGGAVAPSTPSSWGMDTPLSVSLSTEAGAEEVLPVFAQKSWDPSWWAWRKCSPALIWGWLGPARPDPVSISRGRITESLSVRPEDLQDLKSSLWPNTAVPSRVCLCPQSGTGCPEPGAAGTPLHPNAGGCTSPWNCFQSFSLSSLSHLSGSLHCIWGSMPQIRSVNYTVLISKVGITMLSLLHLWDFTKLLILEKIEHSECSPKCV